MAFTYCSDYECAVQQLFDAVCRSQSLHYVAHPMVSFVSSAAQPLPEKWHDGTYPVRLYLYGLVPLGTHHLVITVDPKQLTVRDNGFSRLIQRWDHLITITPLANNRARYCDRLVIEAGMWTPIIGWFARRFYKHRQKRWRLLVARNRYR